MRIRDQYQLAKWIEQTTAILLSYHINLHTHETKNQSTCMRQNEMEI